MPDWPGYVVKMMRDELTLFCRGAGALSAVFSAVFSASLSLNEVAAVGDFVGVEGTDAESDGRPGASADACEEALMCVFEFPSGMVSCSTRAFKAATVAESCDWWCCIALSVSRTWRRVSFWLFAASDADSIGREQLQFELQ